VAVEDVLTPEAIRTARQAEGWSIADAARELKRRATVPLPDVESVVRSWKRWERDTAPSRLYRPLLMTMLSLGEDPTPASVDVSGDWWAAWQSSRDRSEVLAVQPVRFHQLGDEIKMKALRRGRPIADGGYLGRGELRLWDNELLMGWYAANDGSVRSKGTLYLVLHPAGQRMTGRWVGLSWDGDTVTGLGAMARTEDDVRTVIAELIDRDDGGRDR
jgi:hypothetical protein